jgi:transcriptional regulator of acetoin/glycerol metabolism
VRPRTVTRVLATLAAATVGVGAVVRAVGAESVYEPVLGALAVAPNTQTALLVFVAAAGPTLAATTAASRSRRLTRLLGQVQSILLNETSYAMLLVDADRWIVGPTPPRSSSSERLRRGSPARRSRTSFSVMDVTELARKADDAEAHARSLETTLAQEHASLNRLRDLDRAKTSCSPRSPTSSAPRSPSSSG